MQLGTTFAPHHIRWLGLPVDQAFKELLSLKLDFIRLGCYWNQTEVAPGGFDFTQLESLLDLCEAHNQKVVLSLGMKAPRWPEFYIPSWCNPDPSSPPNQESCLFFVDQTIKQLKTYTCITHWQIENEPLHPSGPDNFTVPESLIKQELKIVHSLDSRPKILTFWGNDLNKLPSEDFTVLVDIVGIDIYYQQFVSRLLGFNYYRGPQLRQLQRFINSIDKPVWITELQAEPWEDSSKAYDLPSPQSISPEKLIDNFNRAKELNPEAILFWGYEYWHYRKAVHQDSRYWDTIVELISDE